MADKVHRVGDPNHTDETDAETKAIHTQHYKSDPCGPRGFRPIEIF